MRIIGGRDYYDGAGYGVDTEIIFQRKHVEDLSAPDIQFASRAYHGKQEYFPAIPPGMNQIGCSGYEGSAMLEYFNIIVAGKVYPGIKITKSVGKYNDWNDGDFVYDYEKAWAIAENLGFKDILWNTPKAKMYDHFRRELTKDEVDWLGKNKIVTAAIMRPDRFGDDTIVWTNGDFLKLFKFYRVLDTWTTHMEIANYVGGVLPGAANPMVEISDKSKIVKHGHDPIRSFRNMPRN